MYRFLKPDNDVCHPTSLILKRELLYSLGVSVVCSLLCVWKWFTVSLVLAGNWLRLCSSALCVQSFNKFEKQTEISVWNFVEGVSQSSCSWTWLTKKIVHNLSTRSKLCSCLYTIRQTRSSGSMEPWWSLFEHILLPVRHIVHVFSESKARKDSILGELVWCDLDLDSMAHWGCSVCVCVETDLDSMDHWGCSVCVCVGGCISNRWGSISALCSKLNDENRSIRSKVMGKNVFGVFFANL